MINKLTIGIPVYNGESSLRETLSSIVSQVRKCRFVEVLISDNCSTDTTPLICQFYVEKYDFVRYNVNSQNIGFDGNIARIIELSTTDYIWFLGDDDEIAPGGIEYILELIDQNLQYAGIVINYSIVSRQGNKLISERVINQMQDKVFTDANSLLGTLGLSPNFLSSIVINKKNYVKEELSKFYGLKWFHFIVFLQMIEYGKSYFVAHPFVLNKGIYLSGPNEANAGGVSIKIMLDLLDHIYGLNNFNYTYEVKKKVIDDSLGIFYRKVVSARMYGAKISYSILRRLLIYYWTKPQLYMIVLPLYFIPGFVYRVIYMVRTFTRETTRYYTFRR